MHTRIAIRFKPCLHVRFSKVLSHLFLFNLFFSTFFPSAQNYFIAHEAEEQVQIGRPGTQ